MRTFTCILVPVFVALHCGSLATLASPVAAPQPQEVSPPDFYRGTANHWAQMAHDTKRSHDETYGKRQIHNADYGANPNGTSSSAAPTPSESATTASSSNAGHKRDVLTSYPMIAPHTQEEDEPGAGGDQPGVEGSDGKPEWWRNLKQPMTPVGLA